MCGGSPDLTKDQKQAIQSSEDVSDKVAQQLKRVRQAVKRAGKTVPPADFEAGRKAAERALAKRVAAGTARVNYFEPGAFVAVPSLGMSVINGRQAMTKPAPPAP